MDEQSMKTVAKYKGTVIDIYITRCSLKVRDDFGSMSYIHYVLLAVDEERFLAPHVNDKIEIEKLILIELNEDHYFLTSDSILTVRESDFLEFTHFDEEYVNIVRTYELDLATIIIIHLEWSKICLKLYEDNLMLHLLTLFSGKMIFPTIKTPKLVEYVSFNKTYPYYSYFTSGVHHSHPSEMLMGYFKSDKSAALFSLNDDESMLFMQVITFGKNGELKKYLNKLVYITKFIVLTEVHRGGTNLLCLLVKSENIHLVNYKEEQKVINDEVVLKEYIPEGFVVKQEIRILIRNISVPTILKTKKIVNWIEASIFEADNSFDNLYLCLEESFSPTIPFLDIGCLYNVYMSERWQLQSDYEISRINHKSKKVMKISKKSIFIKKHVDCEFQDVFLTEEIINTGFEVQGINFIGKIKNRVVNDSKLTSRTQRVVNSKRFGTPGENRNHILQLESSSFNISLYLNNWECKQCPLGLVPNVLVIIRNFDFTNRYAKSNIMTSYQIIGYHTNTPFNTANLNSQISTVFTSYFSNDCIPCNVLMRGKIKVSNFNQLTMSQNELGELTAYVSFKGSDALGSAMFTNKDLSLVKQMLCNGRDDRMKNLYALIEPHGKFSLNAGYKAKETIPELFSLLRYWIKSNFIESVVIFDMVARRIEAKSYSDSEGLPLWLITDVIKVAHQ